MPRFSSVLCQNCLFLLPILISFTSGLLLGIYLPKRRKSQLQCLAGCLDNSKSDEVENKKVGNNAAVVGVEDTPTTLSEGNEEQEEEERFDIPENAPDHCPGISSESAGASEACAGCPNQSICKSGEMKKTDPSISEIREKLANVKRKVLVLSGKGGVGKSTVSSQLSWALQDRGFHVGLLDIDACGPSVPMMTGCKGSDVHLSADGWSPVYVGDGLAVMSIGFLLPDEDDAIIWRGPKKNGLIRQFLTDVIWGDLDILIIDTPPGTSDEHLSIVTYLKEAGIDGAVVVTTPQEASLQDVRKEISFCKKVGVPIVGVIENMTNSVFDCQNLDGAKIMCSKMSAPYAGQIPMDRDLLLACESGKSLAAVNPNSPALLELNRIIDDVFLPNLKLANPDNDNNASILYNQ